MVTAGAPLTDSGLHFEAFGQLASVGDLAAQVFVCARDEGDDLVRNSVVPQQLPQYLSIHAVKGLLSINEIDVKGGVSLN